MRTHHLLAIAIALLCVGCDVATKRIAESLLAGAGAISYLGDLVRFELVFNPGAMLGLGGQLPEGARELVLIWLVPSVLLVLCFQFVRSPETSVRELLALALIAGGGIGNWLDRLLNEGTVTDFVSIGVGPLRTGIFNVADVAVMAGVGLLLLFSWRRRSEDA
jgi:signal peptidase II